MSTIKADADGMYRVTVALQGAHRDEGYVIEAEIPEHPPLVLLTITGTLPVTQEVHDAAMALARTIVRAMTDAANAKESPP